MNRNLKLDCLRGFAAMYVMVGHGLYYGGYHLWGFFGQDCVMLFFVLSAFTITYSLGENSKLVFRDYLIKRFRRIYPMYVIALLLSWVAVCRYEREMIAVSPSLLMGNLLLLQDLNFAKPGNWFDIFYNGALWSLSYEWCFYLSFFPVWKFVEAERRRYVVFAISLLATLTYFILPNPICLFLSYFVLWWMGVELAREFMKQGRVTWTQQLPMMGLVVGILLLWVSRVFIVWHQKAPLTLGFVPVLPIRHFLSALSIVAIGIQWHYLRFRGFKPLLGIFGKFATVSYGVYLYHWPIIVSGRLLEGIPILPRLVLLSLLTLLFSWFIELRIQPLFVSWSRRFLTASPNLPLPG